MRLTVRKHYDYMGLAAALLAMSSSVALAQDSNAEEATKKAVELEPVVVVGGRVEQNLEDIAGSVSVMTSEDIEDRWSLTCHSCSNTNRVLMSRAQNGTAQNFVRGMGADRVMMIVRTVCV